MNKNQAEALIKKRKLMYAEQTLKQLGIKGNTESSYIEGLEAAKNESQKVNILKYFEIYPTESIVPQLEILVYSRSFELSEDALCIYENLLEHRGIDSYRKWFNDPTLGKLKGHLTYTMTEYGTQQDVSVLIDRFRKHIKNRTRAVRDTKGGTELTRVVEFLENHKDDSNIDEINTFYDWLVTKNWERVKDNNPNGERTQIRSFSSYIDVRLGG